MNRCIHSTWSTHYIVDGKTYRMCVNCLYEEIFEDKRYSIYRTIWKQVRDYCKLYNISIQETFKKLSEDDSFKLDLIKDFTNDYNLTKTTLISMR